MRSPNIAWISPDDPPDTFPDIESAFDVPDGLLAAGGDLSPERLIYAYRHGIFPWYDSGQPILWWSPDPRCLLPPDRFHVARRLRRSLPRSGFEITFNTAFESVIGACAAPRNGQRGTWITPEMSAAYRRLHADGWAHSVEVHRGPMLVGGVYGLAIGRAFFGESMFSREDDASKAALLALCRELVVCDCQVASPHLRSLGATLVPRREFARLLREACRDAAKCRSWTEGRSPIGEYLD